jgi:hypothetical protein
VDFTCRESVGEEVRPEGFRQRAPVLAAESGKLSGIMAAIHIAIAIVTCATGYSQTFEVASVKPIRNLRTLVTQAFDLQPYQLSAPASLDGPRFDVSAKFPGAPPSNRFGPCWRIFSPSASS